MTPRAALLLMTAGSLAPRCCLIRPSCAVLLNDINIGIRYFWHVFAALQTGSPRSPRCILVEDVLEHLSCGLCRGPVASSLILSCSHLFCGDCLWQHLQKRQSCPTCSMALRAVPVRCLAMDKVAASIVPSLPQQQQQQYAKRSKDGQCTADKVRQAGCVQDSGNHNSCGMLQGLALLLKFAQFTDDCSTSFLVMISHRVASQ